MVLPSGRGDGAAAADPSSTARANGTVSTSDAAHTERMPLLGGGSNKPSNSSSNGGSSRFIQHMHAKVSRDWADVALLACYPITGLLDSSSVFIWGSFLSMQTGNTIYLGLGIVAPSEGNRWIKSLISILSFCLGSAFFSAYHRRLGGRKRWTLVSSYSLQWSLIIIAALMVTLGPKTGPSSPLSIYIALPIALIAFQSGGQAVTSRVLQYGTLTSVVLTSIYCDLFADPGLFAAPMRNVERNRRAAAPVLLLIGAMAGGAWAHSEIGLMGALWTAVVLKALVIAAWCFWPGEKNGES